MLKTVLFQPPCPQARWDAPLSRPSSRLASDLNVPRGKGRSWPAQGWAGEISVRLRGLLHLRPRWMTVLSIVK